MVKIRRYQHSDLGRLVGLHPGARRLSGISPKQAWVAEQERLILGYAVLLPVPGLEGITELDGFVAPEQRRQGLGSRLLHRLREQAKAQGIRQIAYPVPSLANKAALFLRHHHFYVEHEEWHMELSLKDLPPFGPPSGCTFQTYPRSRAIPLFRRLYEESFAGCPWYQPYLTDAEVAAELERAEDLLFLLLNDRPVGFIWLRREQAEGVQLEPVGIIQPYQGQGLGRLLLRGTLHLLAAGSSPALPAPQKATLGVWRSNEPALQLYTKLGFRQVGQLYYLAYDLN